MQVWGLDPGFRDVFNACNVTTYDKQKPLQSTIQRYSGEQYYHEAHVNACERKVKKWQQSDATYMAIISSPNTPSCKSCSIDSLKVRPPVN